jgi:hypothetical protein
VVGEMLGVGLQERPGEQGLGVGERCGALPAVAPEFLEHLSPGFQLGG